MILGVVGAVMLSGVYKSDITNSEHVLLSYAHSPIITKGLALQIFILAILSFISLKWATPKGVRRENEFDWEPVLEVAKLFAAIFLTIVPLIAILKAGENGALRSIVNSVTHSDGSHNYSMYFWITGILSGFLDNALLT